MTAEEGETGEEQAKFHSKDGRKFCYTVRFMVPSPEKRMEVMVQGGLKAIT
uniref:Uncharacterized protein n=1 Tax=Prevotella sp. GTC17254 TaxID=3236794 RepID=A0AB33IW62_9BACT